MTMKLTKIKLTKNILLSFAVFIALQVGIGFLGFNVQTAQAYKCQGGDYFDSETQRCRAYKKLTPTRRGDGSVVCPDGTHHRDGDDCWGAGGEIKNYPPVMDNGQPIPVGDIYCPEYSDIIGDTYTTYYDPVKHQCCNQKVLFWDLGCVDPVIPERDPSLPPEPGQDDKGGDKDGDGVADPITESIEPVATKCGQEARVNILACGESKSAAETMTSLLRIAVIVLSFIVGIAAVGGLAWASVLYAKAQDNEGNVSEAKTLIRNVVIGLLLYVFLVALTNYLIPGGVFGSGGGWW